MCDHRVLGARLPSAVSVYLDYYYLFVRVPSLRKFCPVFLVPYQSERKSYTYRIYSKSREILCMYHK